MMPHIAHLLNKTSALFLSLSLVLTSTFFSISSTQAGSFKDVPADSWFYQYVEGVFQKGIVGGYKDIAGNLTGYYGPGDLVTVGQVAKMVGGANGQRERNFPNDHWAKGWIELFPQTLARRGELRTSLDNPAGREIVAELIAEATRLAPIEGQRFTDTSNPWVNAINEAGFADGYDDGHFLGTVNRAEMAKLASAVRDYRETTLAGIITADDISYNAGETVQLSVYAPALNQDPNAVDTHTARAEVLLSHLLESQQVVSKSEFIAQISHGEETKTYSYTTEDGELFRITFINNIWLLQDKDGKTLSTFEIDLSHASIHAGNLDSFFPAITIQESDFNTALFFGQFFVPGDENDADTLEIPGADHHDQVENELGLESDAILESIAFNFAEQHTLPSQEDIKSMMQGHKGWSWVGNGHCKPLEEAIAAIKNDQPFFDEFKKTYTTYGIGVSDCGDGKVFIFVIGAN